MYKYNKTHDMMAPFVVNSRANGLKFPEGYWYQHRNNPLTTEEYLESRWVAEPANLYDNDIPIHNACAFVFTTAERARDLRNPPAYVLGHASGGSMAGDNLVGFKARSTINNLEENEEWATRTAQRVYEAAGITAQDVAFENAYDGFSPVPRVLDRRLQLLRHQAGRVPRLLRQPGHLHQRADADLAQRREHRQRPDPVLELGRHHPAGPGPGR